MALVGFAGPRVGPAAGASALVAALVGSVLASGRGVATGCAVGVDSLVVSAALAAQAGSRLSVACAFGPPGLGVLSRSSASPASLAAVVAAGGRVAWWAGGGPGPVGSGVGVPPPVARLVRRSLAFVRGVAASGPGAGLVVLVSAPPSRPFAAVAPGRWPSCGSGSWGAAGAAALLGLPVVVFPVGWPGCAGPASLPALPGPLGAWAPAAASGLWAAGWLWRVGV